MPNILVIDDEPDFCDVVKTFLEAKGHKVSVAFEAEKGLASIQRTRPDVVLLDIKMPDVNGLELLPRIKTVAPDTPVIVVTALNDYRIADLLYESGADEYLTKPVRMDALAQRIERLLEKNDSEQVS